MVSRILKRASEAAEKRADDNEATIKNRIDTFIKNTDEILNQYPCQTKRVSTNKNFIIFELDSNLFSNLRLMVNVMSMPFSVKYLKPSQP